MNQFAADQLDDEEEEDFVMPRKKRDEEEMDITPMIDITFLLLIFFVVCSKMDPTQMAPIPNADQGLSISAKNSAVIFVEPGGKDKVIVKDITQREFSTDEDTRTGEIIEYVTKELKSTSTRFDKKYVMIMSDGEVPVREISKIRRIIGDNFDEIERTHIAVKEQ